MADRIYRSVQFIGLSVSATPGNLTSIEDMSDDGKYLGYDSVEKDIEARLALLIGTIEKALGEANQSAGVLKIFVIPEFFFRGNKGAYFGSSDALFGVLFKKFIDTVLSRTCFMDWLFVLGTFLSSVDKVDRTKQPTAELFPIGDDLLNVYYRLHPKQMGAAANKSPLAPSPSLLRRIDELETLQLNEPENEAALAGLGANYDDGPYLSVLKSTLNYCDLSAEITVANRCFIIQGGSANPRVITILKKHKSKEDFILNAVENNYIQSITKYKAISELSEKKRSDRDEYSIFEYGGLSFGVEICLDHSRKRLLNHWKNHPMENVDVQLIPSCGMDIRADSVVAKKGGLVFNCDGEYVILDGGKPGAENGEKSHTALKLVEKAVTPTSPAVLSKYIPAASKVELSHDGSLYPCNKYHLHIYGVHTLR